MIDHKLAICAVASVLGHYVIAEALSKLPERPPPTYDRKIEVRVVAPPAPPPPPEPPPPAPPPPPPEPVPVPRVVHQKPTARPVKTTVQDTVPKDVPPAPNAVVAPAGDAPPVFGVTMESTSQGGKTEVAVGNTTNPAAPTGPAAPTKPAAAPVAAVEVTKMPLPQGRCSGTYTEAARAAALEGVVILDLVVDASGKARDIQVVQGLDHGLTEAAITALRECRFSPGEKDGQPVAVKVRGFKIRFVLQDGQ